MMEIYLLRCVKSVVGPSLQIVAIGVGSRFGGHSGRSQWINRPSSRFQAST